MDAALAAELEALEALGRRRDLAAIDRAGEHAQSIESPTGAHAGQAPADPVGEAGLPPSQPNGRARDFTSNDYLGLATHPAVVAAAHAALDAHGAGARAARLLGGGSAAAALETQVAAWQGAAAALLFPTGYQANVGILTTLGRAGDAFFSDALNHASLIDGMRLAKARTVVHPHLDLDALERELTRALDEAGHDEASSAHPAPVGGPPRRLIVTESVFSMDGDRADLDALNDLARTYDAWLIVDEAHAVGLLGPEGRGLVTPDHDRVVARVLTGGKALGAAGALVVGTRDLVDLVANRARSFIFTTAPPPSLAASLAAAVDLVRTDPAPAAACRANAKRLAAGLGLPTPAGAIVPIPIGPEELAVRAMQALAERGFDVRAVRPPTVPPGTCRLRAVCHADQTATDVDALLAALADVGRELDLPALEHAPSEPTSSAPLHTPRPFTRGERAPALFVTGTDTDAGKTVAAALLCRAFELEHGGVHYWKPVQTGSDSDSATVARLADLPTHRVHRPGWHLAKPASPHEAAEEAGVTLEPARLSEGLDGLRRNLDAPLVVELAGGLLVPFTSPAPGAPPVTQLDWLAAERTPLVLVARSGLGTLNHTMLSLAALQARSLTPRGILLVGEPHPSNARTLRAWTGLPLVEVPRFDPLDTAALDAFVRAHRTELRPLLRAARAPTP